MAQCMGYTFFATDQDGNALAGGSVYSYYPGTLLVKPTYSDYAMSAENTNPVVLDAAGQADIHVSGPTKLVIKSSVGRLIDVVEDISGIKAPTDIGTITNLDAAGDLTIGGALTVGGDLTIADDVDIDPGTSMYFYAMDSQPASIGGNFSCAGKIIAQTLTFYGALSISTQIRFYVGFTAADVLNNTIFLDAADSMIKIRDNAGDFKGLYTP